MAPPPPRLHVSVVIPALEEAARISATVRAALAQPGPLDVTVADGGSADGTAALAETAGARVVQAPRGRALQMNVGARDARGDALVFLHADTRLPPGGLDAVRRALGGGAVAGCFRTTFDAEGLWLQLWQARVWMRSHRLAFGDRALFVRRDTFEKLGGFPLQPIFEDLEFVRRVRREGRFAFLDEPVETSARRFARNGALGQQARNLALWLGWNARLSPHRLKRFYSDAPGERD